MGTLLGSQFSMSLSNGNAIYWDYSGAAVPGNDGFIAGSVFADIEDFSVSMTNTSREGFISFTGSIFVFQDSADATPDITSAVLSVNNIGATFSFDANSITVNFPTVAIQAGEGFKVDFGFSPTDISLAASAFSENQAGVTVGTLSNDDFDGTTTTYTIAPNNYFEIVGDQLKLKAGVSLDYETQNGMTLEITATDASGALGSVRETFAINFADVNEAPELRGDLTGTVNRGGSYTITADDLSYADVDDNAAAITFVVSNFVGGYVSVNGNREFRSFGVKEIIEGKVVFHQDGAGSTGSFVVIVADDGGAQAPSGNFTININDPIPNRAPAVADDIADQTARNGDAYSFQIPIGSFVDPDGNVLSYSVGALPAWLSFDAQTRTFSGTPASGDAGTVQVTVTASDGSLSASDTFNLTVTIAGSPDNLIQLSNDTVAENSKRGTVIGELSATDDDGAPYTFTLTDNPQDSFKIVGNELRVSKHADLDFESRSSYRIDVLMTDSDGAAVEETIRIKVSDVEESPRGTRFKDKLFGDALDNIINGRRSNDKLTGGDGADTFVFRDHFGRDVIRDFEPSEGDKIDLSRVTGINGYGDMIKNHTVEIDNHLRISAGDGSVLIIKHTGLNDLDESMFVF
jgi:hypothetical protein